MGPTSPPSPLRRILRWIAIILLLGAGIGSAWYKFRADRSGAPKVIAWCQREIVRAVTELARHGVGGRNLRVFRTSADREAALLQQLLGPALRSRNPDKRKEAIETLENLAAVATHLKHLLLIRDLRKIAS